VERYGDYIIFVGDADAMYFLSPDGKEQFSVYNPGWYNYTFLMADNIMYFGTGPTVSMVGPYDIVKKEFLWFLPYERISARWYSFSAIHGDLVYMGTADGSSMGYYAFNRHNGEIVWEERRFAEFDFYDTDLAWELFLRDVETLDFMAPTIWKDLVIFTGGDKKARAFDAKTGGVRWEQELESPVSSSPTIASGRVYFGLLGDYFNPPKLVCISAQNGKLLWEMKTEGSLLSAPVIAGKRIIFGTDLNIFYVLEEIF
jgi:outer membrane protein assembly factor BamB